MLSNLLIKPKYYISCYMFFLFGFLFKKNSDFNIIFCKCSIHGITAIFKYKIRLKHL